MNKIIKVLDRWGDATEYLAKATAGAVMAGIAGFLGFGAWMGIQTVVQKRYVASEIIIGIIFGFLFVHYCHHIAERMSGPEEESLKD